MDKQTILVVDDELVGRQLLNAVLISDGYQVLLAENGSKAIEVAENHLPDLILMDVMMPDMDGFTTIKKIKEIEALSHTPVILVTALDDRDNRIKGLEAGATDYITKPFDRVEVLAKIKNHAKKSVIIKSQNSNNSQSKDGEQKLKFLIDEILSTSSVSDPSFLEVSYYNSNSEENLTGKFISTDSNGLNCFLFGSEQPSKDDSFHIALINIWLNQLVKEDSNRDSVCLSISEKIKTNHFFDLSKWWFVQVCLMKDETIFIKGFNMDLLGNSSGMDPSQVNQLSEANGLNISDMNYAVCSFNNNPDVKRVNRLHVELSQLSSENNISDIETKINNFFATEPENGTFIMSIHIKK